MNRPPTLFLLFNHRLTRFQEEDARNSLGVERIIEPPLEIREFWSQVPPEADSLEEYLAPVFVWLAAMARSGDFVLVQGEFGATWLARGRGRMSRKFALCEQSPLHPCRFCFCRPEIESNALVGFHRYEEKTAGLGEDFLRWRVTALTALPHAPPSGQRPSPPAGDRSPDIFDGRGGEGGCRK